MSYIEATPTIGVASFKICFSWIAQSAVAALVRQSTDALLACAHNESEMSTSADMTLQALLRARKHHLKATFASASVAAAMVLSTLTSPAIAAPEAGLSRTLDGMTIYLGVIASAIASEHLPAHPEAQMHGGKRPGKRFEHVVVAIYDAKTNERVTDATVKASVRDPGISVEEKTLESMTIADALSYGNYFAMKPKTRYAITISVLRPGRHQPTQAQFDYGRQ